MITSTMAISTRVKPPSTFAELVAAAKAVKTKDMGGFFAGNDGGLGVLSNMLIWASGNEQLNPERTAAGFVNLAAIPRTRDFPSVPQAE